MAACGLDFGTSNSTAGLMQGALPQLVHLEDGKPTLPSAVFFPFEAHEHPTFGRTAIATYVEGQQGRFMRALKSVLGTSLIEESTQIGRKKVSFTDILGLFIAHIKTKVEATAGAPVTSVVMGRPVFFVDDDATADARAQATLQAIAHAQGFKHVTFQFEPIAAALDYEQQTTAEQTVLVVDIGGGTSDFSIVRVGPQHAHKAERKADILANTGVHIGGTDLDKLFSMAHIMPHLGYGLGVKGSTGTMPSWHYFNLATWQRINQLYTRTMGAELRQMRFDAVNPAPIDRLIYVVEHRLGHRLAGLVEDAKIALSTQPQTTLPAPFGPTPTPLSLTQTQFESAIAQAVQRVAATVQEALTQASLTPAAIDAVFLTGGSAQVPLLRHSLLAGFPQAKVVQGDMFGSVGLGLTLAAARTFGPTP